jgi:predicted transcriptional regulator
VATPVPTVTAVANQPKTPKHGVRISDDLWQAAQRVAADRDETLTEVIRRALERYVKEHPGTSDQEKAEG